MKHRFYSLFGIHHAHDPFRRVGAPFCQAGVGRGRGRGRGEPDMGPPPPPHAHGPHAHGHGRHVGPFGGPGFGGPSGFGGPAGFRGFEGFFRGRGPRARRGDVRILILSLLQEEARNGYQIMQALSEKSGGAWKPSPGSVYPTLEQLEDEGLVKGETSGAGGRTFALTPKGRTYAEKHAGEAATTWASLGRNDDPGIELAMLARQVVSAAMQVGNEGAADVAKAKKILATARKELYQLLANAGDEPGDDEDEGE